MEVSFSLLLFLLPLTSASCFGRDAHFKKSKAPVIVQPNRADPTKVLFFVVADITQMTILTIFDRRFWCLGTRRLKGLSVWTGGDQTTAHSPLPPSPPSSPPSSTLSPPSSSPSSTLSSSSLDTGCVSGRKAQKCRSEVDILSTRPTKPKSRY